MTTTAAKARGRLSRDVCLTFASGSFEQRSSLLPCPHAHTETSTRAVVRAAGGLSLVGDNVGGRAVAGTVRRALCRLDRLRPLPRADVRSLEALADGQRRSRPDRVSGSLH